MNLNINAHIGHRINLEAPVMQVREVLGIDLVASSHVPLNAVRVTVSDQVLSDNPDGSAPPQLYCRDCDLYLIGPWEYAS